MPLVSSALATQITIALEKTPPATDEIEALSKGIVDHIIANGVAKFGFSGPQ